MSKLTLRDLVAMGEIDLDEEVTLFHWDPDDPEQPTDPREYADECGLGDGAEFKMMVGVSCERLRPFVVCGDTTGDERDYAVKPSVCSLCKASAPGMLRCDNGRLVCDDCAQAQGDMAPDGSG